MAEIGEKKAATSTDSRSGDGEASALGPKGEGGGLGFEGESAGLGFEGEGAGWASKGRALGWASKGKALGWARKGRAPAATTALKRNRSTSESPTLPPGCPAW